MSHLHITLLGQIFLDQKDLQDRKENQDRPELMVKLEKLAQQDQLAQQAPQPPGPQGEPGENGGASLQSLIQTSVVESGENCTNGGVLIESGIDVNTNGVLDSEEVTSSD